MSSKWSALLSATFHEPGYDHLIELVHQRDPDARRRLAALDVSIYDEGGKLLHGWPVETGQEIVDLDARLRDAAVRERVMVVLDARYDETVFPYRPHHYGYLHRRGSSSPPLYYAVGSALGGVPDRLGAATRLNNFDTYLFRRGPFAERCSVMLGNLARFAAAEAQVFAYYGTDRVGHAVQLGPRAHVEVPLAREHAGQALARVETKSLFRLASYVVRRREPAGDLALFDHLFTYFK